MTEAHADEHQAGPAPDAESTTDSPRLGQLVERVSMINRIHGALRSTLNIDDIYSIIMTTMISRSALDLSRAFLIEYDGGRHSFHGLTALGASDREEHDRLQDEIIDEEKYLAEMVRDLHQLEPSAEERALFNQSLLELSSHAFWITTYQRFSAVNGVRDEIRKVTFARPMAKEHAGQAPGGEQPRAKLLDRILNRDSAQVVSHAELVAARMPKQLLEALTDDSLWCPIRTNKGLRLLLIADKVYQDEPISGNDILHMDWFAGQVALALENAEMFHHLESAYNSLRELDQMKTNFLATISHELRTPLTAITGYLQLLLEGKIGELTSSQIEVLKRIQAHGDMLTGKVNDVIEIAELDSDRSLEVEIKPIDPLNVLMNILPRVESRRAMKDISIEPILTHSIPSILCNAQGLGRILFHLLDNAIKFSDSNSSVRVEFLQIEDALHITVADNGIGISREQLKKIFDAFYQVDSELTRSYDGLGIGLAIIKRQIELTKGQIEVESELGRGSRFTIIYPLAEQP